MYYGEKVCLRAYKEEDISSASKFVNDKELKKFLVTTIPFPMTYWVHMTKYYRIYTCHIKII